jgi:hypothetical protein
MGHPIYHLELFARNCRAELRLNDLPLISLTPQDEMPVTFAPPINPFLVGELNLVDVDILPMLDAAGAPITTFADAEISGNVRRFEKGDIFAPGAGDVVAELAIPEDLKERVREEGLELPQQFTHIFANEAVDFSAELSNATPFSDREALVDYALFLRDLAAARDAAGLLAEMDPKIHAFVHAYDEPYEAFADSLRQELAAFVAMPLVVDFDRAAIELRSCCSGRLWELRRIPGLPLLQSEPDALGAVTQFPIVVAERDGRLRVVR